MRKKILLLLLIFCLIFLFGCNREQADIQIAATTLPVYNFTSYLCQGTDIEVKRLITEEVSCLHDYSLQVDQMQIIEESELLVISGAGLESFLEDAMASAEEIVDASTGIAYRCAEHSHDEHDGHHHEFDPHIWLSPANAKKMSENIYMSLAEYFPEHKDIFLQNYVLLSEKFTDLENYALTTLSDISQKEIITFHDGFSYMAQAFDLTILEAIEEESGSEASARELIQLINLAKEHHLPAIFVEKNNPGSAAYIISTEIDIPVFQLDMALSGESYFDAMYRNIDTLKEAFK